MPGIDHWLRPRETPHAPHISQQSLQGLACRRCLLGRILYSGLKEGSNQIKEVRTPWYLPCTPVGILSIREIDVLGSAHDLITCMAPSIDVSIHYF